MSAIKSHCKHGHDISLGERTEADPYQGQGQGRSVEPGGKEEEREGKADKEEKERG